MENLFFFDKEYFLAEILVYFSFPLMPTTQAMYSKAINHESIFNEVHDALLGLFGPIPKTLSLFENYASLEVSSQTLCSAWYRSHQYQQVCSIHGHGNSVLDADQTRSLLWMIPSLFCLQFSFIEQLKSFSLIGACMVSSHRKGGSSTYSRSTRRKSQREGARLWLKKQQCC